MSRATKYFFDASIDENVFVDDYGIDLGCEDEAFVEAETIASKLLEERGQPFGSQRIVVRVRRGDVGLLYRVSVKAKRLSGGRARDEVDDAAEN